MIRVTIRNIFFLILFINNSDILISNEIIQKDFYFQTRDRIKLDCSFLIPDSGVIDASYPVIIFCHGFGKSKEDTYKDALVYAKSGFCSFIYSFRGQGLSGGKSFFIDRTDMEDLFEIVRYIKSKEFVDSSKIVITGASQGGLIPLMAASNGLNVKCLITDLVSFNYLSDWVTNNTIKTTFIWSLGYSDDKIRYDSTITAIRSNILSGSLNNSSEQLKDFIKKRDFSSKITNIKIPILISNSWQDKFFSSNSIIENIQQHNYYHNIYIGFTKGHGSAEYESENEYHRNRIKEWIDNNIYSDNFKNSNYYDIAVTKLDKNGKVMLKHNSSVTFPFTNYEEMHLYLDAKNKLTFKNGDKSGSYELRNDILDTSLNIKDALFSEFSNDKFIKGFIRKEIFFDSDILNKDYLFLGIPIAEVYLKTFSQNYQINIQILEISSNKNQFITSINYNCNNNIGGKITKNLIKGSAVGHIFSKGNKIRLIITNLDTREGDNFLRTNPFVLPILKKFSVNILYGINPSRIIIPLQNIDK